jgi:hypothetical protein
VLHKVEAARLQRVFSESSEPFASTERLRKPSQYPSQAFFLVLGLDLTRRRRRGLGSLACATGLSTPTNDKLGHTNINLRL